MDETAAVEQQVVWPRFPDREFGEPLAACYRAMASETLTAAWSRGERGLFRALPRDLRYEPIIPETFRSCFVNYNRPEDLAHLWNAGRDAPSDPE